MLQRHESTNCLRLMFTPFSVIDCSLSMCYFLLSSILSQFLTFPYFLISTSYILHTSSTPVLLFLIVPCIVPLLFALLPHRPGSLVFPWRWPPACVYVCVCSCTRPDLPEQRAPARLVTSGRRRRREQQRHAGHRGWSGVVGATVSRHQLALLCDRISVGQHEWWEGKYVIADLWPL